MGFNCLKAGATSRRQFTYFRSICQYFPVYHVAKVEQQMVTYFRRFLKRAMFSPSYLTVLFCFSYIKFTTRASTLVNKVCFVDNRSFNTKRDLTFFLFQKMPKFYFILTKRFQIVSNTRNRIFVSFGN